jgi:hypothetical protein
MRKINIIRIAVLFFGLFFAFSARALDYPDIFGVNPFEGPGEFISYMYMFAAGTVGILAMASFVYAGVQYSLSAAKPGLRSLAKERIMETLVGLGLIMGATTLFYTINPALVEIQEPDIPEAAESPYTPAEEPSYALPLGETTFFFDNPPPSAPSATAPAPVLPPLNFTGSTQITQPQQLTVNPPSALPPPPANPPVDPGQIATAQVPGNAVYAPYDPLVAQQATQSYLQQGQQTGTIPATPPGPEFTVKERVETSNGNEWDNIEGTNIYCPSGPDTSQCTAVINPTTYQMTSYTCPPGLKPVLLTCDDLIGTGGANGIFQNIDFLPLVRSMKSKGGKIYVTDMYHGCTDCGWYDAHFTFVGVSQADKNAFLKFFYDDKAVYTRAGFSLNWTSGCTQLLLDTISSGVQTCVNPATSTNPCSAQVCTFSPNTNQTYATSNSVTLAWVMPSVTWPIYGYSVYRCDPYYESCSEIMTTALKYNFTDTGLLANTPYYYRVIASSLQTCDESACSALVMDQSVNTLPTGSPAPAAIQQCATPTFCYVGSQAATCSTHPNPDGPVHYTIDTHCVQH